MSEMQGRVPCRRLWPLLPLAGLMACVLIGLAQGPSLLAGDATDARK